MDYREKLTKETEDICSQDSLDAGEDNIDKDGKLRNIQNNRRR